MKRNSLNRHFFTQVSSDLRVYSTFVNFREIHLFSHSFQVSSLLVHHISTVSIFLQLSSFAACLLLLNHLMLQFFRCVFEAVDAQLDHEHLDAMNYLDLSEILWRMNLDAKISLSLLQSLVFKLIRIAVL